MGIEQLTRARDRLLGLSSDGADQTALLEATMAALHDVTTFSWGALMPVDPQTLLPTAGLVEGFAPETCTPFWDHELLAPGYNKFNALARSTDPVATLSDATDGDLSRAPIYTSMYASLGVADELRVAFVLGNSCWAVAALVRGEADGPSPDLEVGHVRALVPIVARALRDAAGRIDVAAQGPGAMVVLDADNEIVQRTVASEAILDDLRTSGIEELGTPASIRVVATRARFSRSPTQLATRVRGTSGRWLRVTAAPTEGDNGTVAVVIEPARPNDLLPLILETYGFSPREIEVVLMLARGFSTKEIAVELCLSTHTVRDHVKAILDKGGVNSRGELVARLFADHLLDAFHLAVHRV